MEIILLVGLSILCILFVSSSSMLIIHLFMYVYKFLVIQMGKIISLKNGSNIKHKKVINKFKDKQNFKIRLKMSIEKFTHVISEIVDKPKCLLSIAIMSLFFMLIIITKISIVPVNIKNYINIIILLSFIILVIASSIYLAKDKSVFSKINSLIILVLYMLAIGLFPIIVFSKPEVDLKINILVFLLFFCMVLFTAFIAVKYYYTKMAVAVVIVTYGITIFFGAIAFAEFYCNKYPLKFSEYIVQINQVSNPWTQVLLFIKIGLRGFFEFPSEDILSKISAFQFSIGKITELLLLGYIAAQFSNIRNCSETIN